jgi:hypothetical protein
MQLMQPAPALAALPASAGAASPEAAAAGAALPPDGVRAGKWWATESSIACTCGSNHIISYYIILYYLYYI